MKNFHSPSEGKHIDIDEVITTVLSGNADEQEYIFLEEWLSSSMENRLYYVRMQDIWLISGLAANSAEFDARSGFNKWAEKLQAKKKSIANSFRKHRVFLEASL